MHTIKGFIELVGLSPTLHSHNHKNFKEEIFKILLQKFEIVPTYTKPHSPWQKKSEPEIGEVKQHEVKLMLELNAPICL